METLFTMPYSRFGGKVPTGITIPLNFIVNTNQYISDEVILQGKDNSKAMKVAELIGRSATINKNFVDGPVCVAVLQKYFEKQEKVINDTTFEELLNLSQSDYDKEKYLESLSSLTKSGFAILAYICLFSQQNKEFISNSVACHLFGPLLANCNEDSSKYLLPLIADANDLFSEYSLSSLACTDDDIASNIVPVYDEDYVKRMRKRISRRKKNTVLPIASCETAIELNLKRPEGRPQEFAQFDHDYEYEDGEQDDQTEEANVNYKYVEDDEYEYDYEYDIIGN